MQALGRVAAWVTAMIGMTLLQGATTGAGFITQTVQLPLWAVLLFILLPGEAFADLARTAVERFDTKIDSDDESG